MTPRPQPVPRLVCASGCVRRTRYFDGMSTDPESLAANDHLLRGSEPRRAPHPRTAAADRRRVLVAPWWHTRCMATPRVHLARVYDDPGRDEGTRVLVDRLWPRGLSKDRAQVDVWLKEIAPSQELRRWYGHDPAKHTEFSRRYVEELADSDHAEALAQLRSLLAQGPVTLLTATKDLALSQASVLAEAADRW